MSLVQTKNVRFISGDFKTDLKVKLTCLLSPIQIFAENNQMELLTEFPQSELVPPSGGTLIEL